MKVPKGYGNPAIWEKLIEQAEAVDTKEVFRDAVVLPGVFERLHHLCEITEALMNFYEYQEESHELLDCITEVELEWAADICKYIKPEVLFHHDD